MSHHDQKQDPAQGDPGHGDPGHVHDENWNGAAEFGMAVGGLAGIGGGVAVGGAADGAGASDHADEETKQETGTAGDADPSPSGTNGR